MKKKLSIYCGILAVVIICNIVVSVFHYDHHDSYRVNNDGEQYGLELSDMPAEFADIDSIEGGVRTTYKPTLDMEVFVRPQNIAGDKVLLSYADGKTYKVEMQKVKISLPLNKADITTPQTIILGITICIFIPLVIWLLIMTFRIIKSIRKGEIFVTDVAKYLEKLGAWVIIFEFANYGVYYLIASYTMKYFTLAQYDIVFGYELNTATFILGIVLMIVSQIILMGKELKEEQDLTI